VRRRESCARKGTHLRRAGFGFLGRGERGAGREHPEEGNGWTLLCAPQLLGQKEVARKMRQIILYRWWLLQDKPSILGLSYETYLLFVSTNFTLHPLHGVMKIDLQRKGFKPNAF
jgi:hypothetical protein